MTAPVLDGKPWLLTRAAAARLLGIPLRSFARHVQPSLPCVAIGRRPMFEVRDLEAWIESRKRLGGELLTNARPAMPRRATPESDAVRAIRERLSRPRRRPVEE